MANYRIVCVEKQHRHITAVGTGDDPGRATQRWTVAQVRTAIKNGHRFYTESISTGKKAEVEPYDTIRSKPDQVTDNNLDDLRACSFE